MKLDQFRKRLREQQQAETPAIAPAIPPPAVSHPFANVETPKDATPWEPMTLPKMKGAMEEPEARKRFAEEILGEHAKTRADGLFPVELPSLAYRDGLENVAVLNALMGQYFFHVSPLLAHTPAEGDLVQLKTWAMGGPETETPLLTFEVWAGARAKDGTPVLKRVEAKDLYIVDSVDCRACDSRGRFIRGLMCKQCENLGRVLSAKSAKAIKAGRS